MEKLLTRETEALSLEKESYFKLGTKIEQLTMYELVVNC